MSGRTARPFPETERGIGRVVLAMRAALLALLLAAASVPTAPAAEAFAFESYGPAAFARARADGRLILLYGSAAWCHWCHVMERTTYADPRVQAVLRAHFVSIRADVDEYPELEERLGAFGWPATAIYTPEAEVLEELEGYQAPDAFLAVLEGLVQAKASGSLRAHADRTAVRPPAPAPDLAGTRAWVEHELDDYYDPRLGGWGYRQKYPLAAPIEHALLELSRAGDPGWRERVTRTLDAQLGLMDPVWGGLYQYSVGGGWDEPHFEKIMTVQAGAIDSYARAYAAVGEGRYLEAARKVRAYLNAFLRDSGGAFYVSQDADVGSHDRDSAAFVDGHEYYRLDDGARRHRGMPRVDRSVYAQENGLAISAYCRLFEASRDPEVLADARRAAEVILQRHRRSSGGFAHAATGEEERLYLGDNAAFGRALLDLFAATGEARYLEAARGAADFMLQALQAEGGGFYAATADPAAPGELGRRRQPFEDNAAAARFLIALSARTGDGRYGEAARRALAALADPERLREQGRFLGEYLLALEEAGLGAAATAAAR